MFPTFDRARPGTPLRRCSLCYSTSLTICPRLIIRVEHHLMGARSVGHNRDYHHGQGCEQRPPVGRRQPRLPPHLWLNLPCLYILVLLTPLWCPRDTLLRSRHARDLCLRSRYDLPVLPVHIHIAPFVPFPEPWNMLFKNTDLIDSHRSVPPHPIFPSKSKYCSRLSNPPDSPPGRTA